MSTLGQPPVVADTMRVYTSPYPPLPFPRESIYTFLFQTHWDDHAPTTAAFIDASTSNVLTRIDLRNAALSLAHGLRSKFRRMGGVSLEKGDVTMIFSPNNLAFPVALVAGFAAGLCMSLASASHTPRELEHQWNDCRAKAVLVHPSLLPVTLKMFERLDVSLTEARRRIVIMDFAAGQIGQKSTDYICMSDLMYGGSVANVEEFPGEKAEETVMLCYSSGTTGQPKGVEITHRSLVAALVSTTSIWPKFRSPYPRMLGFVPFYHIFGAMQVILAEFLRGCPVVIMSGFDPETFCRNIQTYKITHACVVPPVILSLVNHSAMSNFNLESLEYLLCGAAPLSISLIKAFDNRTRASGIDVALIQGYGLTESVAFQLPTQDWLHKAGSVGFLGANIEARLILESGEDAEEGDSGELWLRAPAVFKGYLGNIEATRASITPDGWFKTGDVLTRDREGYWEVVDRKKELIKYKGYQVAPAELESVLLSHPDIVDAGVVGVMSEELATELPRAYIVHTRSIPSDARRELERTITQWVKDRVANHKQLRGGVVIVDAIPKSPSGKILRRMLRDEAKRETEAVKPAKPKL